MKTQSILIIGGGVAGLSAGIYGRLNGFDTEIIEMHHTTGGQCTALNRDGYRFDYCINWLAGSASGEFQKIFRETRALGHGVKIINFPLRARLVDENGRSFYIYANLDEWEKYLGDMAPEDRSGIHRMCTDMKKGACMDPFSSPPELRSMRELMHKMIRFFPALPIFRKYRNLDAASYIRALKIKNPKLRFFLNKLYAEPGFSALTMLLMGGWFHSGNAGYPEGGSRPIAQRMTDHYLNLGGKLRTSAEVKKIIVKNKKAAGAVLETGDRLHADFVISACDGYSTIFKMLKGRFISSEIEKAYKEWKLLPPIIQVSFGIRRELPENAPVTAYISNKNIGTTEFFSAYRIINYSLFDPTMAPPGKSSIVLRFESPWKHWEKISDQDYIAEKQAIQKDATDLIMRHYKIGQEDIEVTDVATPLTNIKHAGVWRSSYQGFFPENNSAGRLKMTLPKLSHFYMAGQWISPGGGLPPSMQSGKWAIQYICNDTGKHFTVQ